MQPSSPRRRIVRRRVVRRVLVAAVVMAIMSQVGEVIPAGASPGTATPSGSNVTNPMEYFTNQWNDPMDFSDAADLDLEPGYMVQSGTATMGGGVLSLQGVGQLFLLRHDGGAYPTSTTRDPLVRTLDADVYTRVSFRMQSDRNAVGAIGFRTCDTCSDGFRYFNIAAGWHTYDFDMKGGSDWDSPPTGLSKLAGAAWGGKINYLYLSPAFNTADKPNLQLDDFRVYRPSPSINVQLNGGTGSVELWQDTNNNQSDDGDFANGAGQSANLVGIFPAGSNVALSAGEFRSDIAYRFYTVQNGSKSSESSVVVESSASSPTPVVSSPSETGGTDFATAVRGNPWDFNDPGDVFGTANVNASVHDGQLLATHAATGLNDPVVMFDLGSRQIDATLYDKFEITITYQGPWGLQDAPGGGMVGRVIWRGFDGATQQVSLPIVMRTGTATYVIPLRTNPPGAIADPSGNSQLIGWGTGMTTFVDMLRFDPHEDPGGRSWQIDDVKLLSDESVNPTYDIHFHDDTWIAGTTTDLYADTDRDVTNGLGTLIGANLPVGLGDNAYTWNGSGVGPGQYWIHAVMHRAGVEVSSSSTGVVDVGMNGAGPPPQVNPLNGNVVAAGPSQAQVIAFYNFIIRAKFFCGIARARHQTKVVRSSLCRLLLR